MSKLIRVSQNHTVFCLIPCAVSVRNALLLKYCLPLTNATGCYRHNATVPCLPPHVFWEVMNWTYSAGKGGTESCILPYGPAASIKL